MTDTESIGALSEALVGELLTAGKTAATAESCTGGWIAKSITDISGSSGCFAYGLVSYSNGAKESLLGVNPATLEEHGAVSEAVVREMAQGALSLSGADVENSVPQRERPRRSEFGRRARPSDRAGIRSEL